jgi:hypothetical protein
MTSENAERILIDPTEDLWWMFYLREPQTAETVQPLMDALCQQGLEVCRTAVSDTHFSTLLMDHQAAFYLELTNPSDDVAPYLFLGAQGDRFLPANSAEARLRSDYLLEYGKLCYRVMRPQYAFAESANTYVEPKDIEQHRLTHVCWAQLIGPQFVSGFGRDLLVNAPAWRNENLEDGGLLYVLAASPYLTRGPRQVWQQARDYLGRHVAGPMWWADQPG